MAGDELESLRAGLARTDEEIQRGIARRLELARRIGREKERRGVAVRDLSVERKVLERWREALGAVGVAPARAEAIARLLVEESVKVQEARSPPPRRSRRSRRILVIGGAGSMGAWTVDYLRQQGHVVDVYDPAAAPGSEPGGRVRRELAEAARDAEVIVVATPMRVAPSIYRRLERIGVRAAVIDILSVKAPLLRWLSPHRARVLSVASVHPLFGPSARSLVGRNLLLLDCGDPGALRMAASLFPSGPLQVTRLKVEDHDGLMADFQALPRVISLLLVLALGTSGRSNDMIRRSETTSFHRAAQTAREVLAENPALSFDIQALNPSSAELFDRLAAELARLQRIICEDDGIAYAEMVSRGRALLGGSDGAAAAPARPTVRARRSVGPHRRRL